MIVKITCINQNIEVINKECFEALVLLSSSLEVIVQNIILVCLNDKYIIIEFPLVSFLGCICYDNDSIIKMSPTTDG